MLLDLCPVMVLSSPPPFNMVHCGHCHNILTYSEESLGALNVSMPFVLCDQSLKYCTQVSPTGESRGRAEGEETERNGEEGK